MDRAASEIDSTLAVSLDMSQEGCPSKVGWRSFVMFGIFSFVISFGFFLDGTRAEYSSLSGDQINILTICAKKDHPHLLQDDLVAGDLRNVDYYIPFFVNLIRSFSLPDHNYLRGLNILLFFTSLIYMWGWWFLFSMWGDKWIAAIMAFFARGIMWPPGNELWGIAGLWTMLPRTLFLALLPWALWLWFSRRRSRWGWTAVCFLSGLLANVHPISGACLVVALLLSEFVWTLSEGKEFRTAVKQMSMGALAMLVGMAPYVWTYLSKTGDLSVIDPTEFDRAVRMRIKPLFFHPGLYVERWARPKWLVLVFLPWIGILLVSRQALKSYKHKVLALGVFSLGCILVALTPFPLEQLMGAFGVQMHIAFQLIRVGKYVIVSSLLLTGLLFTVAARYLTSRMRHGRALVITISCGALLLTLLSRQPIFNRVPMLGDDVCRFLWPGWISAQSAPHTRDEHMEDMLAWIREHTSPNSKFVGPRLIRVGALRPVIHDWAGAGMLIEGNPEAFVKAAERERQLRKLKRRSDAVGLSKLIAGWGADYWVTHMSVPSLSPVYSNTDWVVYDLHSLK